MAWLTILFVIALLSSLALSPILGRAAFKFGVVDLPGERKIHSVPVPRIGGAIIASSIGITIVLALGLEQFLPTRSHFDLERWWPVLGGGTIVFLGGILDDLQPQAVWKKLLPQIMGAVVAVSMGVVVERVSLLGSDSIELGILAVPLTLFWIVGITNAFNLVDGLDGLSAGLGSIAAGTCAALFLFRGNVQDAGLLIIVLGALLGFLPYNFNPAKVYLGDSGSLLTGYLLAVATIIGVEQTPTALAAFIPFLVLGLPILDTAFSMFRRVIGYSACNGWAGALKRMFEADRQHFHHRMLDIGFSHRNAVLTLYAIGTLLSVFAVLSVVAQYRNAGIILIAVGLAAVIGIGQLDYREAKLFRVGTLLRWYESTGFDRRFFLGFIDLIVITAAYGTAFLLKFSESPIPPEAQVWFRDAFPTVLIMQLACFYIFGLYRGVWRMMDLGDLLKVAVASCASVATSYSLSVVSNPPPGTINFFAVDLLLLALFAGGVRSVYRILDYAFRNSIGRVGTALIYGAGRTGQMVLHELRHNAALNLRPVGFIDDDIQIRNRMINGTPVLGTGQDVRDVLDDHQVNVLIVSSASTEDSRLMEVVRSCKERGIMILKADFHFQPFDHDDELFVKGSSLSFKATSET